MTLIVAERKLGRVSLTSDSRLNYGKEKHFDFGIKVTSIPVKIISPKELDGTTTVDYEHHIGLAVAGSFTAASTIKDYIAAALTNIQYTPGYTDFSFEGIAKFVAKFCKKINYECGQIFFREGLCQVIMAGYCPKELKFRAFVIEPDLSGYPVDVFCTEVLKEDGLEFYGSGRSQATKVHEDHPDYSTVNIVRKVIFDQLETTVGGSVQYGHSNGKNFVINGLMIDNPQPDNPNNCDWNLWGINHFEGDFEVDDTSFHLSIPFMMMHDLIYFSKPED